MIQDVTCVYYLKLFNLQMTVRSHLILFLVCFHIPTVSLMIVSCHSLWLDRYWATYR